MNDKTKKMTTTMVAGAVLAGTLSHKLEHLDPPPTVPVLPGLAIEASVLSSAASALPFMEIVAQIKKLSNRSEG